MKKYISIILVLTFLLVGCGSKASDMATSESFDASGSDMKYEDNGMGGTGEIIDYELTADSSTESVSTNRKILERVYMDVETKEFDVLID